MQEQEKVEVVKKEEKKSFSPKKDFKKKNNGKNTGGKYKDTKKDMTFTIEETMNKDLLEKLKGIK